MNRGKTFYPLLESQKMNGFHMVCTSDPEDSETVEFDDFKRFIITIPCSTPPHVHWAPQSHCAKKDCPRVNA